MFCPVCGKKLEDGEVCTCSQKSDAAQSDTVNHADSEQTVSSSVLPQGKELAESAKNAASAVKNNPIVNEVENSIIGSVKNPVKQTVEASKRRDILWMILAAIEGIVYAAATTVFSRRLLFMLFKALGSSFGGDVEYSEVAEGFKTLGITLPKQLGTGILSFFITAAITIILIIIAAAVCKRKAEFSRSANMLASAFLPASVMMCISIVLSYIYVPASLLLFAAGYLSFIILAYLGMQKLDKFEKSPFWIYIVFAVIVTIAGALVSIKLSGALFNEILEELESNLRYLF